MTNAGDRPVFTAGGHCFTWLEVIEAAGVRGEWAALQRHVAGLLAHDGALAAADAEPARAQVQSAANEFRYRHKLLSADEIEGWLARWEFSVEAWMGEMRRSLLEPADDTSAVLPEDVEQSSWVHAVCSGKLAAYARTLAEEVAVHLSEGPLAFTPDTMAALPKVRARFCRSLLSDQALASEIGNNTIGWTRMGVQLLRHPDDAVLREAALCVRLDGRELADVAADAGAQLLDMSVLLDDVEPPLRTRLLAADPGELIGPVATKTDHQLVLVMTRDAPSSNDPSARARAEETIINRAMASAVNRHVNWHEDV